MSIYKRIPSKSEAVTSPSPSHVSLMPGPLLFIILVPSASWGRAVPFQGASESEGGILDPNSSGSRHGRGIHRDVMGARHAPGDEMSHRGSIMRESIDSSPPPPLPPSPVGPPTSSEHHFRITRSDQSVAVDVGGETSGKEQTIDPAIFVQNTAAACKRLRAKGHVVVRF